jgi:glycosyltransferase involved in cell wall biosynthesis
VPDRDARELAILVEPGDRQELATAIRFLVEHSEWRDALAANARREVERKYQWRHHVDKIISGIDALSSTAEAGAACRALLD